MAAKISGATERALERVRKGETPFSAAKAEGISPPTIYNAIKREKAKGNFVIKKEEIENGNLYPAKKIQDNG